MIASEGTKLANEEATSRMVRRPDDPDPVGARSVRGWRCRYDLQKGTFDVPPEFKQHNANAVGPDKE
jgi:hypothetical protein